MSNRATRLADEYIKALNMIDLEFRPRLIPSKKDRDVIAAWRSLFGELTQGLRDVGPDPDSATIKAWNERCSERYVKLESAMASALGFRFTDEELRRGICYPQGHSEREQASLAILRDMKNLLAGEGAINMKVKEVPVAPEAAAAQTALMKRLADAYTPGGALRVAIENEESP
jgi:hypothetical protein